MSDTTEYLIRVGIGNVCIKKIFAKHWEQFAQEAGLAKPQAKRRILDLAKSLPVTARQLQEDPKHGFAQHEIVEQIIVLIEQRCALTIQRLTAPEAQKLIGT